MIFESINLFLVDNMEKNTFAINVDRNGPHTIHEYISTSVSDVNIFRKYSVAYGT
jgi:hypothetical protein